MGKIVHFRARLVFGSTSTYDAVNYPTVSLPVTGISGTAGNYMLNGYYRDTSAAVAYRALPILLSTTAVRCNTLGTGGLEGALNSASPFTWASTDEIQIHGTYETA
jgi:hypothetical protein